MKKKPLVNKEYLLEKFSGKGGWTYARVPDIPQEKRFPFGWVRVSGSIDDFELKKYKLMPMGNGKLFLPVKAEIRKKIGKQVGDFVKVVLYADETPSEIPEEIKACFENEPGVCYQTFIGFTDDERKVYLDWIYDSKKEETKAERIVKMMDKLLAKKKFYE